MMPCGCLKRLTWLMRRWGWVFDYYVEAWKCVRSHKRYEVTHFIPTYFVKEYPFASLLVVLWLRLRYGKCVHVE